MDASSKVLLIGGLLLCAPGCTSNGSPPASLHMPEQASDDSNDAPDPNAELTAVDGGVLGTSNTTTTSASPCAASDLALCFTFDGSTKNQAASGLQPSETLGVSFVAGKDGMAASFDAKSALRFGPSTMLDLPADGATIEAWILRSSTGTDSVVFDDDNRFSLTISAAGHVWCKSSTGEAVGVSLVAANTWVHVACVIDQGVMNAYVNGVRDGSGPGSIAPSPMSGAAIGGNAPSGEAFAGAIDMLRVFRVAHVPQL